MTINRKCGQIQQEIKISPVFKYKIDKRYIKIAILNKAYIFKNCVQNLGLSENWPKIGSQLLKKKESMSESDSKIGVFIVRC